MHRCITCCLLLQLQFSCWRPYFVDDPSVGVLAVADISVVPGVPVVALVPVVAVVPAPALLILFLHVQRENIQKCIKLSYHTKTIRVIYYAIGLSDIGLAKNYQLLGCYSETGFHIGMDRIWTPTSTFLFVYSEERIIGKQ